MGTNPGILTCGGCMTVVSEAQVPTLATPVASNAALSLQAPASESQVALIPAPAAPPPKPKRTRAHKAPKDSRVYKAVMAVIALKAQGKRNAEIATLLDLSPHTIQTYMHRAHQRGWLTIQSLADPDDQLDIVLRSKVIRNINTLLDTGECAGDKVTTLATAKGLGLFKDHQVVKTNVEGQVGMSLKVAVEMPTGLASVAAPRAGTLGGTPFYDAEIVKSGSDEWISKP